MDFTQLLIKSTQSEWLSTQQFICLKSTTYQPIFFSYISLYWAHRNGIQRVIVDMSQTSLAQLYEHITMSFLGQRLLIWITNLEALEISSRKTLFKMIEGGNYEHLIFFVTELTTAIKSQGYGSVCLIPQDISFEDTQALLNLWMPERNGSFKKIFSTYKNLELDQLLLLARYSMLLGRSSDIFLHEWLERILEPEQSLFTVSQYFFAKQKEQFFVLWKKVNAHYADEFWIAFWTEQLWQALLFFEHAKRYGSQEAKKIVTRLPFSFMQKDWQSYHAIELIRAHDFLYTLDYSLKNGTGTFGLELFIQKFLHSSFNAK